MRINGFTYAAVVTKSDTADNVFYRLRAPSNGNIKVTDHAGNDVVIPVLAGENVDLLVVKVWSTGTTVTGNIIGYK